jgi:hypothetical protein
MWFSSCPRRPRAADAVQFVVFIQAYLALLLARWDCLDHDQSPRSPSEKPIPLTTFRRWDIDDDVLLWMLFHDHVDHFKPTSYPNGQGSTSLKRADSLILTDESCFALNAKGADFADSFLADALLPQVEGAFQAARDRLMVGALLPAFQPAERLFTWGDHLLKHFRQPAPNQELILASAEELQWPEWFDDPLPRGHGRDPKLVLHDTIKDLNRRQLETFVHFKGDGSGQRIGWELR